MEQMQTRTTRQNIVLWAGVILILIVSLWNLENLNIIHVLYDEYGYWSAGAFFAGKDWSEVTSHASYYSYGYGIFIGILMRLINTPEIIYKCMVVFNSLCLVGSYFIGIACIRKLFKDVSFELTVFISLLVTMYPNNIIQVQITWPENLLYFLFWLITWLMIKIVERPKMRQFILLPLICAFSYVTHMRTVGIVIAVCMTMFVLLLKKKISWKHLLCFVAIIGTLFVSQEILKAMLTERVWLHMGDAVLTNDYASQAGNVTTAFTTLKGWFLLITGVLGKFYAMGLTTAVIAFFGTYVLIKKSFRLFLHWKNKNLSVIDVNQNLLSVFVLLVLLGTTVVSTLSMLEGRQDSIIYGRYFENILGPILTLGIIALIKQLFKLEEYVYVYIFYSICVLIAYIRFLMTGNLAFNLAANVSVSAFFKDRYSNDDRVLLFGVAIGVLSVLMILLGNVIKRFGKKVWMYPALIAMTCLFIWIPNIAKMWTTINYTQNVLYSEFDNIRDQLLEHGDVETIYYLTDASDSESRNIEYIRYLMPDVDIQYVHRDDIDADDTISENTTDWLIVYGGDDVIWEISKEYAWLNTYWGLDFLIPRESALEQYYDDKDVAWKNTKDSLIFGKNALGSQNDEEELDDRWVSNGEAGYIVFGPYVSLSEGCYEFILNFEVNDCKEYALAIADIVSGGRPYRYVEVSLSEMIGLGRTKISVEVEFEEPMDNIEFRLWIPEKTYVEIETMEIRRK